MATSVFAPAASCVAPWLPPAITVALLAPLTARANGGAGGGTARTLGAAGGASNFEDSGTGGTGESGSINGSFVSGGGGGGAGATAGAGGLAAGGANGGAGGTHGMVNSSDSGSVEGSYSGVVGEAGSTFSGAGVVGGGGGGGEGGTGFVLTFAASGGTGFLFGSGLPGTSVTISGAAGGVGGASFSSTAPGAGGNGGNGGDGGNGIAVLYWLPLTLDQGAVINGANGGAGGASPALAGQGGLGGAGILYLTTVAGSQTIPIKLNQTARVVGGNGGAGGNPQPLGVSGQGGNGGAGLQTGAGTYTVTMTDTTFLKGGDGGAAGQGAGNTQPVAGGAGGAGILRGGDTAVVVTVAASVRGGTGGTGSVNDAGGTGGAGGAGVMGDGSAAVSVQNGGAVLGGDGGAGGDPTANFASGNGGAGGGGILGNNLAASVNISSGGTVQGGNGGAGGRFGTTGGSGGMGGSGIQGDNLVSVTVDGSAVHGGAGGAGGLGSTLGGDGGAGGVGISGSHIAAVRLFQGGTIQGGAGGVASIVTSGAAGNGGAGGAGMAGSDIGGVTLDVGGIVQGGAGGAGGNLTIANPGSSVGDGGAGGAGILGDGIVVVNSGHGSQILGGNGGVAGIVSSTGTRGLPGPGGAAIQGSNLTIENGTTNASIQGGLGGDGITQAPAILFTGGANALKFDGSDPGLTGDIQFSNSDPSTPTSLKFNQDVDVVLANNITGAGSIEKTGAGVLTLTGSNTYTGGTTFTGGVLAASSDGNLGDVHGGLAFNGGTLQWNAAFNLSSTRSITLGDNGGTFDTQGFNSTIAKSVGGTGSLVKNGAGTLTLAAVNTYGGSTTINAGTLQLGGGGPGSPDQIQIDGEILNNGNLVLAGSNSFVVGGELLGNGRLSLVGSMAKILDEAAYTGSVAVDSQAWLIFGDSASQGSRTDSALGDIENDGVVLFQKSNTYVYGGKLSGSGQFQKYGSGTLVLNGISPGSTTSAFLLEQGGLMVGDASHPNAVLGGDINTGLSGTVLPGTVLSGFGKVDGAVSLLGGVHLQPGNSMGTLTVGSLTAKSGSILDIAAGAPGPDFDTAGASGSVTVTNNLNLQGMTVNVSDAGGLAPGVYNLFTYGGMLTTTANDGLSLGTVPSGSMLRIQSLTDDKRIDLVNLPDTALSFWDADHTATATHAGGGTGTWSNASSVWTDMNGDVTGPMSPQPGFAVFRGAPGIVTVSHASGDVQTTGMQFMSDGYSMTGDTLTLVADSDHPAPVTISVGDGNAHSADWTATIDNVLAGVDGLNKTGLGTLVLANGNNTYTGGTTISGGALSVSTDGSLGDVSNTLTLNGGTLRVTGTTFQGTLRSIALGPIGGGFDIADAGNSFTLNQPLSGSGSLTKAGDGRLILLQDNSYTGGTSVTGGTLQVGENTTFGSIAGNLDVGADGTVAFYRSNTYIFGGVISGNGTLRQMGVGSLVLTGENTFTGTTLIDTGIVQIGDGGNSGSLHGNIVNNGQLTFNRADDTSFDGVISGRGNLTKLGAGALALTGDSSAFTGITALAAGTLQVDGSLGGQIIASPMSTLSGIGTTGAVTVMPGATLSPGNAATPTATMNVRGDLTFLPGSTYRIDTAADGSHDSVHATGAANLAGSVADLGQDGNYAASTSYTILTADGGVHGTFEAVSSNLAFLTPSVIYGGNDVDLLMQMKQVPDGGSGGTRPIRFADLAVTSNQRAVANALQSLPESRALYSRVLNLPSGAPPAVFDSLSGEAHASTVSTLQGLADTVATLPLSHFHENLDAGRVPGPATAQLGGGDASALPQSAAQPLWAQVFGNWRTFGGDGNAAKATESDGGLFVGGDHGVGGGWRLGGALGYTGSHSHIEGRSSTTNVDSYSATIYGGKAFQAGPGKINVTLGGAYTWHDIKSQRAVDAAGVGETLKADYGASTGQVFTELGYALPLNDRVTVEPFVGAGYSDLRMRGFSESGGDAALSGEHARNDVTATTLGLHAQTTFESEAAQGRLHGTVGWRHAFGDVDPRTTMSFDGSQSFTVAGAPIARDAAVVELGVDMAVTKRTTVGVSYNGQFGAGNQQNAGTLDVRYRF